MSLDGRLDRLEREVREAAGADGAGPLWTSEDERQRYERIAQVIRTMEPAHAALLVEPHPTAPGVLAVRDDMSEAAGRLWGSIWWRCYMERKGDYRDPVRPLAMPPEVAEVYLSDPLARDLHDCEDCGYEVPIFCSAPHGGPWGPKWYQGIPKCKQCEDRRSEDGEPHCGYRPYFPRCPLCGGATGREAYRRARAPKRPVV